LRGARNPQHGRRSRGALHEHGRPGEERHPAGGAHAQGGQGAGLHPGRPAARRALRRAQAAGRTPRIRRIIVRHRPSLRPYFGRGTIPLIPQPGTMRLIPLVAAGVALLLTAPTAQGQIAFGGTPPGLTSLAKQLTEAPVATMPAVDVESLMAEDAARAASGEKGPYRFGFNHATDLGLDNSGAWSELPNGDRVWRLGIACPGAYSINFEFHDYLVPEGARVFVHNEAGQVLGAFTAASNGGHPTMGVDLLPGDRITVEYVEPAYVQGQGRLRIGQVTHG